MPEIILNSKHENKNCILSNINEHNCSIVLDVKYAYNIIKY